MRAEGVIENGKRVGKRVKSTFPPRHVKDQIDLTPFPMPMEGHVNKWT